MDIQGWLLWNLNWICRWPQDETLLLRKGRWPSSVCSSLEGRETAPAAGLWSEILGFPSLLTARFIHVCYFSATWSFSPHTLSVPHLLGKAALGFPVDDCFHPNRPLFPSKVVLFFPEMPLALVSWDWEEMIHLWLMSVLDDEPLCLHDRWP